MIGPVQPREGDATAVPALPPAALNRRLSASTIDSIALIGLQILVLPLIGTPTVDLPLEPEQLMAAVRWVVMLHISFFVVAFLYEGILGGQTIGKRILSLRVIGRDGATASWRAAWIRALIRNLLQVTILGGIPDNLAYLAGGGRTLHDRLSGTRVVGPAGPSAGLPPAGRS